VRPYRDAGGERPALRFRGGDGEAIFRNNRRRGSRVLRAARSNLKGPTWDQLVPRPGSAVSPQSRHRSSSAVTLEHHIRGPRVLVFAVLASGRCPASTIFMTARAVNECYVQLSTSDCDTNFGLGIAVQVAFFTIPHVCHGCDQELIAAAVRQIARHIASISQTPRSLSSTRNAGPNRARSRPCWMPHPLSHRDGRVGRSGQSTAVVTPGGNQRYRRPAVLAFLHEMGIRRAGRDGCGCARFP